MSTQNDIEHLQDMMQSHGMTLAQANVELVRMKRVRIVTSSVPRDVRSALNRAVKDGLLARKKKDHHKPECYYHPDFEHLANVERSRIESRAVRAMRAVSGFEASTDGLQLDGKL